MDVRIVPCVQKPVKLGFGPADNECPQPVGFEHTEGPQTHPNPAAQAQPVDYRNDAE